MVCQNCQSTDIVTIQGQNYCINCGKMVTAPAAKTNDNPTRAQLVAALPNLKSSTNPTKKPASKAELKPIAKPVSAVAVKIKAAKPASKAKPRPASERIRSQVIDPIRPVPKAVPSVVRPVKATPVTPQILPIPSSVSISSTPKALNPVKGMSDLRPVRSTSSGTHSAANSSILKPLTPSAPQTDTPQSDITTHNQPHLATNTQRSIPLAIKTAWSDANLWQFFKFGLLTVLVSILPALALTSRHSGLDLPQPANLLSWLIGLTSSTLVAAGALHLVGYSFAAVLRNTTIYGTAKRADSRTPDQRNWRRAGLASFWSTTTIDLILILTSAVVVLAALGGGSLWSRVISDQFFMVIGQRVIIGLAVYVGLVILLIRQLAIVSTVLGGLRPLRALTTALRIWRKQSSWLLGSGAAITAIGLLGAAIYAAIIYGLSQAINASSFSLPHLLLPITACVVACLWLSLWLCLNWAYWQSIYRQTIKHLSLPNESRLLGGRCSDRPSRLQSSLLIVVTLLMLGAAVYFTLVAPK